VGQDPGPQRHWQAVAPPGAQVLARRTLAHGIDDEGTRYAGNANDSAIKRGNGPYYPTDTVHGVGDASVNWTACGPPREEMHVRQLFAMRNWSGNSRSRYLASPADPRLGLHSTPPKVQLRGNLGKIQSGKPTIRRGRQNRLSASRYTGQSYSQTTRSQGA
jgi:hypothetical protein